MLKILENILDILLPNQCLGCEKFTKQVICTECLNSLPFKLYKSSKLTEIEKIIALLEYQGVIKKLLTKIKFEHNDAVAKIIAAQIPLIFNALPFENINYWIPIPIHKTRLKKRGYNQVNLLFEHFLALHKVKLTPLLTRIKDTPPLFDMNKKARQEILAQAFALSPDCPDLHQKRVVLLDDIFTSGSTLTEAATVLKNAGVDTVYGLTICYKPRE